MLNASIRDIPMPGRFKGLPVSSRGFPVPWFVAHINGDWDFRIIGPHKIRDAVRRRLCWLCGQTLGQYMAFTIGPMCSINRVSSEPPSHRDCAEYAVRACPFLSKPNMRRDDNGLPGIENSSPGGIAVAHNPGATAIWVTRSYSVFADGRGGSLFEIGDPTQVHWYCKGRKATRAEVDTAIAKGLPLLRREAAKEGPEAIADLDKYIARASKLLPAE